MATERFRGADLSHVADRARRTFGDDVMILHTRTVRDGGVPMVEVIAAASATIDRARARIEPDPLPRQWRSVSGRPYIIALIGPTGAGKTTTAAKLAVRPGTFAGARTGLLTIDTYRVGGMEQLATYAELADVPFEVVYDAREIDSAMQRLSSCDVIIIDTPGRSPAAAELNERWRSLLDAMAPDEIHLVLPASLRSDLAIDIAQAYAPSRAHCGATHLLLTKMDEVPRETGVTDMALAMGMPARWIADGQDVPADLKPGTSRILRGYGLSVDAESDWIPA
jgi:flagellar biosynthesis protein FlhF